MLGRLAEEMMKCGLMYGAGVVAVGMGNLIRSSREIEVKEENGTESFRKSSQCYRGLQGWMLRPCKESAWTEVSFHRAVKHQGRDQELTEPNSTHKSVDHGQAEATVLLGEG